MALLQLVVGSASSIRRLACARTVRRPLAAEARVAADLVAPACAARQLDRRVQLRGRLRPLQFMRARARILSPPLIVMAHALLHHRDIARDAPRARAPLGAFVHPRAERARH